MVRNDRGGLVGGAINIYLAIADEWGPEPKSPERIGT